jgi:hypothetical protein
MKGAELEQVPLRTGTLKQLQLHLKKYYSTITNEQHKCTTIGGGIAGEMRPPLECLLCPWYRNSVITREYPIP